MRASIVIRVKNEAENLHKLFPILKDQTSQDFEIIIVNDSSVDNSEQIVFNYFPKNRVKIVNVPKNKFTYPYASNLGAEKSSGEFLVYLSAHSFPVSKTWLSDGLKNFENQKVAGVFAYPLPHEDTNLTEKILYNQAIKFYLPKFKIYKKYRSGVLGTTNAVIRKSLWNKHKFNENWTRGGEDAEWATYWMNQGYFIIQDAKFRAYHSHHLNLIGLIKQYLYWQSLSSQR